MAKRRKKKKKVGCGAWLGLGFLFLFVFLIMLSSSQKSEEPEKPKKTTDQTSGPIQVKELAETERKQIWIELSQAWEQTAKDVEQKYPETESSQVAQSERDAYRDTMLQQVKEDLLKKYSLTSNHLQDIKLEGLEKDWQVTAIPESSDTKAQENVAYIDAGYVTPGLTVLGHPSEKFPVRSYVTPTIYKQVGPKRWDPTDQVLPLPDKTKVIIEGGLGDVEWWNVSLVKIHCADCNDPETYVIHKDGLVKYDYWNCPSSSSWTNALQYGQVVARLSNSSAEVTTAGWDGGKWIDPATFDHSRIFCLSGYDPQPTRRSGKVACYIYKLTSRGREYKGTAYFNPDDLTCLSQ